ncbi:MAG: hypothetical protein BZY88_12030 [SAR202 cluster bacterium Io17-Chloro-G9]|nr:MAG: hypothetical protein BZY88_12030 [SAR202 cluster bacterium Io17-Chloro-G9]
MSVDQAQALDILARLGAQPSVAFREEGVVQAITGILTGMGLGYRRDGYGNIILRLRGQQTGVPPLALVAHMDHPGFEAVDTLGDLLIGEALGGVPAASFSEGVPLQVILEDGRRVSARSAGRHGAEGERRLLIELAEPQNLELPRPVVFDMTDFQLEGDHIHMRAVDDLAGCAGILATVAALAGTPPPGDVFAVFTRAEEVGLVGARLMAEAGSLPPETLVLSAESSRTLPGAEMGSGPVIRVGDAGYTFNAEAEAALIRARETLQARPEGFKVQRQLMSGGVCEASAFAMYGYRTTGIAFPLGNYHNGATDGGIQAEFIHRDDFIGGIELMVEAALRVNDRENTVFRQRLSQVAPEMRQRLQDTAE